MATARGVRAQGIELVARGRVARAARTVLVLTPVVV